MKLAFHENSLNLRGTSVALFDYAFYNQTLLNNNSVIIYNKNSVNNNNLVIDKFSRNFKLIGYNDFKEVDLILNENKIDYLYIIKSGEKNEQNISYCPDLVHAVFPQDTNQIHGYKYAFVSKWLSEICGNNIPFIPHMINLSTTNENLIKELNIPKNSIVYGRYGGLETFDITFVHDVIKQILIKRSDIYFLFMNTNIFYEHSNIIYLNNSSDIEYKTKFINTCDFMIHARQQGESFGLSVGEFNNRNKKIVTYKNSYEKSHIDILGDNGGLYYTNFNELFDLLNNLTKKDGYSENMYIDLTPKNVMEKFNKTFLL